MNGFDLLLIVSAFILMLVALELARGLIFGPDPDLEAPWDPREPFRWRG